MGLEDFIPSESGPSDPQSAEISEKFKEAIKKSGAWIKRVQKDEKKAKKFDLMLARFLTEIIRDPQYDFLLGDLFKSLDAWFSSNFLLGVLSFIYQPVSDEIRRLTQKNPIEMPYKKTFDKIAFHDTSLDEGLKKRINAWVEDMVDIVSLEYSHLQIQKMIDMFSKQQKEVIVRFWALVFWYFFDEKNIEVSRNTAFQYIDFILSQVFQKLQTLQVEEI